MKPYRVTVYCAEDCDDEDKNWLPQLVSLSRGGEVRVLAANERQAAAMAELLVAGRPRARALARLNAPACIIRNELNLRAKIRNLQKVRLWSGDYFQLYGTWFMRVRPIPMSANVLRSVLRRRAERRARRRRLVWRSASVPAVN